MGHYRLLVALLPLDPGVERRDCPGAPPSCVPRAPAPYHLRYSLPDLMIGPWYVFPPDGRVDGSTSACCVFWGPSHRVRYKGRRTGLVTIACATEPDGYRGFRRVSEGSAHREQPHHAETAARLG
jgi:hypothetical protein